MTKHLLLSSLVLVSSIYSSDSIDNILDKSTTYGNIKYYYIQTDKQNTNPFKDSSAKANSIGGQIGIKTASYYGLSAQATFMTTNGFGFDSSVDSSILSRDNGIRTEGSPASSLAQESLTTVGELFLTYTGDSFDVNFGRQVLKSPLLDAKEVRVLPSSVEGSVMHYNAEAYNLDFEAAYLTRFKHRTSDQFINIIEHVLGTHTQSITGSNTGSIAYAKIGWQNTHYALNLYNYYAENFLNSFYANIAYKNSTELFSYSLHAQGIMQRSIGNTDDALSLFSSPTAGKKINAEALSFKAVVSYEESKLMLGYSYVTGDDGVHDSLVLPWDGTPLYTNMITSNNLFVSNYGKGLTADSIYIGGTQSFKIAYTQGYDFTGVKGFQTSVSYMIADNDKFSKGKQQDFNIVLGYKYNKNFSIDLKGIFVKNNTAAAQNGDITQLDDFQQYRVIVNYTF